MSRADLLAEVRTRLDLAEADVGRLRLRFRALPADHPERSVLLRQLEVSAAVAGALGALLELVGPESEKSVSR
jgi:hypothetical protein